MANDLSKGSIFNITIVSFVKVVKVTNYGKLDIPEDQFDNDYKRNIVSTVVSLEKLLNGVNANPIARSIMKSVLEGMDFDPKFPFKPVKKKPTYQLIKSK